MGLRVVLGLTQVGRGQLSKWKLCYKGLMKRLSWWDCSDRQIIFLRQICHTLWLKRARVEAERLCGSLAKSRDRRGREEQGILTGSWIMPTIWRGSGNGS